MALRGFDEYDITLGDEMRGERASRNKSLANAEADLCIRASLIEAIENCDLSAFPNQSVVAGYVRSYARYLGMNPEQCYHRFCAESGFRSPVAVLVSATPKSAMTTTKTPSAFAAIPDPFAPKPRAPERAETAPQVRPVDPLAQKAPAPRLEEAAPRPAEPRAPKAAVSALAQSRFAAPPTPNRIRARISLSGIASGLALVGLVVGLSFGGYALIQDIQRVGFAPLPEAPAVVADAPLIRAPQIDIGLIERPSASAYQADGVLAAMSAEAELLPPILPSRDGPISAINPATSGVFVPIEVVEPRAGGPGHEPPLDLAAEASDDPMAPPAPPPGILVHAAGEAWVRVQDGEDDVIFEGILTAGQQFALPPLLSAPILRTGNAGAIYVVIDGAPYGPVGGLGRVVKNVSLLATDVRGAIPEANLSVTEGAAEPIESPQRRAAFEPVN